MHDNNDRQHIFDVSVGKLNGVMILGSGTNRRQQIINYNDTDHD